MFLKYLEIAAIKKILGYDTATKRIYTENVLGNIGYLKSSFKKNIIISQNHWNNVMTNVEQPYTMSNDHLNSFKVVTIGSGEVNGNFLMLVCFEVFVLVFAFSIEKTYMNVSAQKDMKNVQ